MRIETFYGMQRLPFTAEGEASSIFRSPTWDEVLSRLQYVVDHAGFGVITGECGVGKSTVLRHFCRALDPATSPVCYVADSKLTPRTLYPTLLAQLGYEPLRAGLEAKRAVHREFAQMHRRDGLRPLVVIDEAQGLSRDLIEELRYLRNAAMDGHSLIAVVLVGQPELRDRLRLQAYTAIRQRVTVQGQLIPWDRSEVDAYVAQQLQTVGVDHALFTEEALKVVYQATSGIARLVNQLCTQSLWYGAQQGHHLVDDRMVTHVIEGEGW
jgi:type II secretory pathway predicted ATPase ExeA